MEGTGACDDLGSPAINVEECPLESGLKAKDNDPDEVQ
jgi:hypothetical protein